MALADWLAGYSISTPSDDENRVCALYARVLRIVDDRIFDSALAKFSHAFLRAIAKIIEFTKLNGLRWAYFGAGGSQSNFLPVVAEGAFEGATVLRISLHHSEGARHYAVRAAVADIGLDEDAAELGANDCAGRASLQASGNFAMLAHVRRETPRRNLSGMVPPIPGSGRPSANFTCRHVEWPTATVLS